MLCEGIVVGPVLGFCDNVGDELCFKLGAIDDVMLGSSVGSAVGTELGI